MPTNAAPASAVYDGLPLSELVEQLGMEAKSLEADGWWITAAYCRQAAAMLTRQAEQLQRLAAVVEAARDALAQGAFRYVEPRRKLEAALAALEATDGR